MTGSGGHLPAVHPAGTGGTRRGANLPIHLQLMKRLRLRGALPELAPTPPLQWVFTGWCLLEYRGNYKRHFTVTRTQTWQTWRKSVW